jgi:co-chaperonin GroES (HSP10)
MNIPKSKVLQEKLETAQRPAEESILMPTFQEVNTDTTIIVKPIECLNDIVAILLFRHDSAIDLGANSYKSEGMVIGVGPGLPTADGGRCPSQVKIGDVVTYYGKPITDVTAQEGHYKNKRIVLTSERNLLVRLAPVPFVFLEVAAEVADG